MFHYVRLVDMILPSNTCMFCQSACNWVVYRCRP